MDIYILLFFFLILIFVGLEFIQKTTNKFVLIAVIIVFVLLSFFRDVNIVPDSMPYRDFFLYFPENSFEIGFRYLSIFLGTLYGSEYMLVFATITLITVLIIIFAVMKIYRESQPGVLLSIVIVLFISYYGFFYSIIVLRQGIALSLLLLAFAFALDKKVVPVIICFVLAILFHKSAAVGMAPLIFAFFRIKIKDNILLSILIILGIAYVLSLTSIGNRIQGITYEVFENITRFFVPKKMHYFDSDNIIDSGVRLKFLYYYLIGILCYVFKSKDCINKILLSIYIAGLVFWFAMPYARMFDYFMFYSFLLIYSTIMNLKFLYSKVIVFYTIVTMNLILVLDITRIAVY